MIDIHCHILSGIDDGAAEFHESIEMARIAARDGIHTIVATPHIQNDQYPEQSILERIQHLNLALTRLGISVEILPGAEINALIPPASIKGYTINKTSYVLIEFPSDYLPYNANKIIFELLIHGFKPIIAHPERNRGILQNPEKFFNLLSTNVYVQISAGSITGRFGWKIKKLTVGFLKKGIVDVMASDAHSSGHRPPILSKAVSKAAKIIGNENAKNLVLKNPAAIITGNQL